MSFIIHGISNLMKQHSYMSTNTTLHIKFHRLRKLEKEYEDFKSRDCTCSAEKRESLQKEIQSLQKALYHSTTTFPNNLTLKNFLDYLVIPTLVYEVEYPRSKK
jgi:sterol O-acyltransferase